jgi:pyruvate dehydrogenase (quinone)/pyruvate oxidase
MAAPTASDILIERLIDWGVDRVFGIPGDGVNGVIEALRTRQDRVRFVQVRHEEAAAFMACAHAKWTGRLGVCLSTSGPGGIHLLNGLYDAKMDHQPVLAITGLQYHDLIGTFTQQDVALDRLFADVALYSERVMGAAHVENMVELACRTAVTSRGVAHLTLPIDVQEQTLKGDPASMRNRPHHVSNVMTRSRPVPDEGELKRAAEILNTGRKVCVLAGAGALGARHELGQIAEKLAAPVAKALLGKACLPDDHPHCVGGVGLLGAASGQAALADCDTLLIVGSTFPYIEYYPKPGQARCVQIDRDAQRIGLRYPAEAGLVGDASTTLARLLPMLQAKTDRGFLSAMQAHHAAWRAALRKRAEPLDTPMRPDVVAQALNRFLKPDAIVTTDCGVNTAYAARHLIMRDGMMFSTSGMLASMGAGLPYAAAAKLAYPERQVVAFVGDGGLTMLMGEMATLRKYDLDVKIVVLKNNSLGQIKWEQMAFLGHPEYGCELEPVDFAKAAEAFGLKSHATADPARVDAVLAEAFAEKGPALVEVAVDPNDPLMPPKIKTKEALHLAEALAKGTRDRSKIAANSLRDMAREIV